MAPRKSAPVKRKKKAPPPPPSSSEEGSSDQEESAVPSPVATSPEAESPPAEAAPAEAAPAEDAPPAAHPAKRIKRTKIYSYAEEEEMAEWFRSHPILYNKKLEGISAGGREEQNHTRRRRTPWTTPQFQT